MSNHFGQFRFNNKQYDADDPSIEKANAKQVEVWCKDCPEFALRVTAEAGEYNVLPVAKAELAKHQHDAWIKEVDP